jgi:ribulose-phosphate 3-epimerase
MSIICPTVLAADQHEFRSQIERIQSFAKRIQIDLMDGEFTETKSIDMSHLWLPENIMTDLHLMFKTPEVYIDDIIRLKPNMVIVHAEVSTDIPKFASTLRDNGIKTGLALLQSTQPEQVAYLLPHLQHVLIFSGNLGHFGGKVDVGLLEKVQQLKKINSFIEIGWDGGISLENIKQLADGGVEVLNVGGAIQHSPNPQNTFEELTNIISQ